MNTCEAIVNAIIATQDHIEKMTRPGRLATYEDPVKNAMKRLDSFMEMLSICLTKPELDTSSSEPIVGGGVSPTGQAGDGF